MSAASSQPKLSCHICQTALHVRLARGRKSGKPFVMLVCPADGRHIRAFVADKAYVQGLVDQVEGQT